MYPNSNDVAGRHYQATTTYLEDQEAGLKAVLVETVRMRVEGELLKRRASCKGRGFVTGKSEATDVLCRQQKVKEALDPEWQKTRRLLSAGRGVRADRCVPRFSWAGLSRMSQPWYLITLEASGNRHVMNVRQADTAARPKCWECLMLTVWLVRSVLIAQRTSVPDGRGHDQSRV